MVKCCGCGMPIKRGNSSFYSEIDGSIREIVLCFECSEYESELIESKDTSQPSLLANYLDVLEN